MDIAGHFMESILAGECGSNMEEMRKYLIMNFMFQAVVMIVNNE